MAGVASGGSGDLRPYNGILSEQENGATGETSTECRSSELFESGTPSTSPPFWDIDDEDEDCGLSPSKLYGKYTWKINKFSQINKRELRSNAFEVGGYKWYILIYPQGCDVCNHLSLFLCVANHDKLLPGWSHFAQFTIAVINSDEKKSKHSDTLHRFRKKEHDWGWKKFMELSKVMDGFVNDDTLTIKAKVQVIREKADRLFRCLDYGYRVELVRVYLTNVEQICRKFVEESRSKLVKLIEDKAKWSSFCAFWLGIDQKSRRCMTRERSDLILRVVVKHFFVEKEVTSTLVMDSLYSGLKALEAQNKTKKGRCKLLGSEGSPVPVVLVDQDMFVLIDDVLLLLERVALDPLPLPPKDDKAPQNRMKDGNLGDDITKELNERDERHLTELGRRTIEMFVLSHIFSKIDNAYQEAVALKRQEELIREEAAWLESEQKSKRRNAAEKDKKSKKKQGKQKRNNRKGKDKGRDENTTVNSFEKVHFEELVSDLEEKLETLEDVSDLSDAIDGVIEVLHPDSEERESTPVNWDTDTSEVIPLAEAGGGRVSAPSIIQNGKKESNGSYTVVDDSSSTCSTDSVLSIAINGSLKANGALLNQESFKTPTRELNMRGRATSDMSGWINEGTIGTAESRRDVRSQNCSSGSHKAELEPEAAIKSLHNEIKKIEPQKRQLVSHQIEPIIKDQPDTHRSPKEKTTVAPSSSISSSKHTPSHIQLKLEPKLSASAAQPSIKRPVSDSPHPTNSVRNSSDVAASSKSEPYKSLSPPKQYEKSITQEVPLVMSRPLSAPIIPGPRQSTPVVSMVQSQPLLSRSVSAVGRLNPDPTTAAHHHQSYRNAMMGLTAPAATSSGFTQPESPNSGFNLLQAYPTHGNLRYPSMFPLQTSEFGIVNPPSMENGVRALDLIQQVHRKSHGSLPTETQAACTSGRQSHALFADEFPHLDIINDLLEDEYIAPGTSTSFQSFGGGSQHLNRQYSYPGEIVMDNDMLVGPSPSSSGFQQTRYQENGFQTSYSSLGGPFESAHDFFPQPNPRPFLNGQMDGFVPNQWHLAGSDLPYLSRTSDTGGYPHHIPDYANLAGTSNGYAVFRPSNGQ